MRVEGIILERRVVLGVGCRLGSQFCGTRERIDTSDDIAPLACVLLIGVEQFEGTYAHQIFCFRASQAFQNS